LDKQRFIAITKCDMIDDELQSELKVELDQKFKGIPYMFISSVSQYNLQEIKDRLWKMLNE
jgi:GTP-binding protein